MKLNKYLHEIIMGEDGAVRSTITEEDLEMFICQWYVDIYGREPPMWLAGDRWYDRRKRIIKEAEAQANEEV